jgi:lysophospholipase L1-like esterase
VAPVSVSCTPASGTQFPVGTTSVRCTATAGNGETGSCTFSVTVSAPPRLSRTRLLAFGDSLTEGELTVPVSQATGEGASAYPSFGLRVVPEASYPTQLQSLLRARYTAQASSIAVTNAGRSGERATDGALRLPDLAANLRPEVVLLLAGANDLAGLGNAGVSSAVLAVEAMAKEARFRNARVFIAAMTPPRPGQRALAASLVQTYNARLQAITRGEGAVFVDLYSALLENVNVYIGVDGLHPTEAGYRRMAEAFFDAIRQDLEVR